MRSIEASRYEDELSKIKVKCRCSHVLLFPVYGPDIQVCTHCGHKVYRNDKVRFIDLLSKELKLRRFKNGKTKKIILF